jgi:hypothetical protein
VPSGVPSAAKAVATPSAPDLFYFQRHLAAELHQKCASCHSDPESAGRYLLQPLNDVARPDRKIVLKNYRATLAFLDPDAPADSGLLKKALDDHSGGSIVRSKGSGTYEKLLHFALGATIDNSPPEAIVSKRRDGHVGEALAIDGTLSGDPDGNPIEYRWTVEERPAGSSAEPTEAGDGGASFTPDAQGLYRLELRVHDGRLWSLPASLMVVAEPARKKKVTPSMETERNPARAPAPKKAFLDRRLETKRLRLIRRLHLDLKWRTPRLAEIEQWYDQPHEKMVDALLKDPEVWSIWYEQQLFYFLLLDRFRPKQGRVVTIPERLARAEIPVPIALREIIASTYFNDRNPGNDTFVTVVLEQCLGMVVQERRNKRTLDGGKKMYDGYKAKIFKQKGASQSDFVRIVFRQEQFFRHLIQRTWEVLHGTKIPKAELEKAASRFATDPWAFQPILKEWLTGEEYVRGAETARTKGEIPYVRGLFVDALGRVPTYEELRNVRNAFLSLADPTPIRLVMGRVLLESNQARMPESVLESDKFVKEQFLRLFARPASARELETFVGALKKDPNVTPRTVLWTLISSPEYQTY